MAALVTAASWISANNEIFLALGLVSAVLLSSPGIQMRIPIIRELNLFVSGVSFPLIGRLALPGFVMISVASIYLWTIGGVERLSLTVASGIGLSVVITILQQRINFFPGPG